MKILLAKLWLRATGFTVEGDGRKYKKYVIIAAPHTSNWDLPHALAVSAILGMRIHWIGKHTLFRFPLGPILRALGGVPVDRRAKHKVVDQMVQRFLAEESFVLVVPAEGTRSRVSHWKSGFYHIARGAHVPVALAYVDYAKKRSGVGPYMMPSGDIKQDMTRVRAFYKDVRGKYPALESEPRLKEEDQ